jgi:hypothetical protein
MKIVSAVLVSVLFLHLQCGGSCLLGAFGAEADVPAASSEPPCHHQSESPSKTPAPAHDNNGPCDQSPVTEFKLSAAGQLTLQFVAILPTTVSHMESYDSLIAGFTLEKPPHLSAPIILISVLRI